LLVFRIRRYQAILPDVLNVDFFLQRIAGGTGYGVTIALSSPRKAFKRLDFPLFGGPMMVQVRLRNILPLYKYYKDAVFSSI
jgi:hypothetical protein